MKEIISELTDAGRAAYPTYVFGQGDPSYLRHYIGYSYYDSIGGAKAQCLHSTTSHTLTPSGCSRTENGA